MKIERMHINFLSDLFAGSLSLDLIVPNVDDSTHKYYT